MCVSLLEEDCEERERGIREREIDDEKKKEKKKKEGKREMREVVTSRQFGQTFLLRAIRLRGLGKQNLQSVEGEKKEEEKKASTSSS